jgi:predicted MFS family arabinose efflux permease
MAQSDPFSGKPAAVCALVLVTVFAWLSFIFLPVLVDQYVTSYHLSELVAGSLVGLEVGALTVVTLVVSRDVQARDKRRLCGLGAMLTMAGSCLSIASRGWLPLALSRVIVGSGLGLAIAATNALPALSPKSEKLYALGQLGLCVFGGLLIFAVPVAMGVAGITGVYWLEIAAALIALLVTLWIPRGVMRSEGRTNTGWRTDAVALRAVGGACAFYIVQTALWAFAGRAGASIGVPAAAIATYLGASALCGVGGAVLATYLGTRIGVMTPLVLGFCSQAVFGLMLYTGRTIGQFAAAVLLITFSSVFVTPYLLTVAARLDPLGRVASAAAGLMNFGATVGPMAAGVAAARVGLPWIGFGSAALLVVGLWVISLPAMQHSSKIDEIVTL